MVSGSLPANVQAYFDTVTAIPSYERAVQADAETGKRLKAQAIPRYLPTGHRVVCEHLRSGGSGRTPASPCQSRAL